MSDFSRCIIAWQKHHGRHDLPWQNTRDPYRIWVSEIMLQQTQVATVIPYYQRFLARFPDLASLAGADEDQVLALWSGLGYYSRGRNLLKAAQEMMTRHGGFPGDLEDLVALPGIGRSTAAAIASFAWGARHAILDGNVKRVLARCFGIEGWPGEKKVEQRLWELAESLLPEKAQESYTQGLMDLGATLCTRSRPRCGECPLDRTCVAHRENRGGQLPGRKPARPLPERHAALLLLTDGVEILLEKRPPTGIWGGLWSLPQTAADTDPVAACAALGYRVKALRELPPLTHTFTHFRLHVRPWLITVKRDLRAETPGRLWLTREDALGAALPKPVRGMIETMKP
jgi:A/G-specific adenine glycosylase